ncbi:hypothetical protein LPJ63_000283 [Coemansia sp. RSA 2711]|nr:hypothetical protein LPJ63_000283 [Coemansia sp. RSA 2711]
MFNHSSEPNTVWTIDHDGSVCIGTTSYQSGYSIDVAGQRLVELCFSYGEKPNTEWLYEYGFVPPNNRHDVWPYFVERQGSPQLLEIKQMWLQELQLVPRIMLPDPISLSDGQSCVTPAALLVLCLAALDDCSDQFAQAVGKLELDPPYFSVDGLLIDNDEKLLQVPGLADRALSQCASRLCAQSAAMRAARSPLTATSQAVLDYLDAESHLTDRIATAIKSR